LINNLIIFDTNKHLLYSIFPKACKEIIAKNNILSGIWTRISQHSVWASYKFVYFSQS